jgi:hypothetical protein
VPSATLNKSLPVIVPLRSLGQIEQQYNNTHRPIESVAVAWHGEIEHMTSELPDVKQRLYYGAEPAGVPDILHANGPIAIALALVRIARIHKPDVSTLTLRTYLALL